MCCEFLSVLLFIEMLLQKIFEPIVRIRLSFHFVIDIGDFSLCKCLDSSLLYNASNIWFFQSHFDFNIKKFRSCKVCSNIPYFPETVLFRIFKPLKSHIVSALHSFLCNEKLNSFLTMVLKLFKGENFSREETIRGNTALHKLIAFSW